MRGGAVTVAVALPMGGSVGSDQTYRQRMLTLADDMATFDPQEKFCIVKHRQKLADIIRILANWDAPESLP